MTVANQHAATLQHLLDAWSSIRGPDLFPGSPYREALEAGIRALAALQAIHDAYEDDCGCEHTDEYCCVAVGERCARCESAVALNLVNEGTSDVHPD